jgi:hypothetical protein
MPEMMVRTNLTPQEHYDVLDRALTDVLRASRAAGDAVTDRLMDTLVIYERALRVALGLPVEVNS